MYITFHILASGDSEWVRLIFILVFLVIAGVVKLIKWWAESSAQRPQSRDAQHPADHDQSEDSQDQIRMPPPPQPPPHQAPQQPQTRPPIATAAGRTMPTQIPARHAGQLPPRHVTSPPPPAGQTAIPRFASREGITIPDAQTGQVPPAIQPSQLPRAEAAPIQRRRPAPQRNAPVPLAPTSLRASQGRQISSDLQDRQLAKTVVEEVEHMTLASQAHMASAIKAATATEETREVLIHVDLTQTPDARLAIIYNEILSPPKSLRQQPEMWEL